MRNPPHLRQIEAAEVTPDPHLVPLHHESFTQHSKMSLLVVEHDNFLIHLLESWHPPSNLQDLRERHRAPAFAAIRAWACY